MFTPTNNHAERLGRRQISLRQCFYLAVLVSTVCIVFVALDRQWDPYRFLKAAQAGDTDALETYLNRGVDINYRDGWQTTALLYASSHGQLESVKFLLEHGADPNEISRESTPLIRACKAGNREIVKLLLVHGADKGMVDANGLTAAEHARRNGHDEIAKLLDE